MDSLKNYIDELNKAGNDEEKNIEIINEIFSDLGLEEDEKLNAKSIIEDVRFNFLKKNGKEKLENIKEYLIDFKKKFKKEVEIEDLGQGFKEIILFVMIKSVLKKLSNNAILLIGEPFLYLHPKLKYILAERLSNEKDIQIFITTHDPKLIPNNILKVNFINISIEKNKLKSSVNNIYKLGDVFSFMSNSDYFEYINRNIKKIRENKKLLIVEGITDFTYLNILENLITLAEENGEIEDNKKGELIKIRDLIKNSAIVPMLSVNGVYDVLHPDRQKIIIEWILKTFGIDIGVSRQEDLKIKNKDKEEKELKIKEITIIIDGDYLTEKSVHSLITTKIKFGENNLKVIPLKAYSIENLFTSEYILRKIAEKNKKNFEEIRKKIEKQIEEIKNLKNYIENQLNDRFGDKWGEQLTNKFREINEKEYKEYLKNNIFTAYKGKNLIEAICNINDFHKDLITLLKEDKEARKSVLDTVYNSFPWII